MTDDNQRPATVEELKSLAHPVRWRILRLCLEHARTNKELADHLGLAPATVLRHVRSLLAHGFLAAETPRTGRRGALERPYRATRLTMRLSLESPEHPELTRDIELATLSAHRTELLEAPPDATVSTHRSQLRLSARDSEEFLTRMHELWLEFHERQDPAGGRLSILWSHVSIPER
ncbi:transcriptional regulator, ArsR family [Stackebrandtia albiflava]|uniref:Transcriptional regulator, ArsR family n=1 Tax=Stackebrandtia albiflava TaxID=406432 RepID=A0A562V358_9ACTN|nr:winged helix-turn-helix domain-containing protein [Stackebrandtia albiflava]TWJ12314.1 transcriptional regulator, ArsR family [Stackebrandtia albiflava]